MHDRLQTRRGVDGAPPALPADRAPFAYRWPPADAFNSAAWSLDGEYRHRRVRESEQGLAGDSRQPGFFPSPLCLVTTAHGDVAVLDKVVAPSIANRFPYLMVLSFCQGLLSERHRARRTFLGVVERSRRVAVQFLMPGPGLAQALSAILRIPKDRAAERVGAAGRMSRRGLTSGAPIFDDAYLVYEGRLVRPARDFDGQDIHAVPFVDVGSHRLLLLEIEAISLRSDIAVGRAPLHWRSLPTWRRSTPQPAQPSGAACRRAMPARGSFVKAYQPDYVFPAPETVAFEADEMHDGFAIKRLAPLPQDQVEVDNDRARWPCFFPSALGLITVPAGDGTYSAFPCGSTAVVSPRPLTIAICVSYARINARYSPRASLGLLRSAGRFGCGVPIHRPDVLEAITYLGNVSFRDHPGKLEDCGLSTVRLGGSLGLAALPVHFDCRIVREVRLGTHAMMLGEVEQVFVHREVDAATPIEWCPWAGAMAP